MAEYRGHCLVPFNKMMEYLVPLKVGILLVG